MTMTDLLVAITLSILVGSVAWQFFTRFQQTVIFSSGLTEREQSAYRHVGMVVSQLRRSSAVMKNTDGSCRFIAENGDTITLSIRNDSLYRTVAGSPKKLWFLLDSCSITIPADSGWTMAKISATYPGRFKESHRITQTVTLFVDPRKALQTWNF